jgi:Derlin-2/3
MANANIWGIPIKAIYLPFAYVIISVFVGSPYIYIIHGIIIGHIYYFLVDVVPHVYGKDVLTTPQFLIDQLGVGIYTPPAPPPPQRGGVAGLAGQGGGAPAAAPPGGGGGHNWDQADSDSEERNCQTMIDLQCDLDELNFVLDDAMN